ncbi:MAG: hypothetical protein NC084_01045 [Bacteroides sp.]|nr:hypothetical protein [Eubacterium sp.]MCM1417838.1 hypothetical protein [Roseburia sp.]MCM1461277.1 hypothetical protein [Bacteroides sp.]
MKKLRRTVAAAMMSAVLTLSGCGGEEVVGDTGTNGGAATAKNAATAETTARVAENEAGGGAVGSMAKKASPTLSVNGNAFTVDAALYALSENGDVIFVFGERDDIYTVMLFATTAGFTEGTLGAADFKSGNEYSLILASPSTGEAYSGATPGAVSDPGFTAEAIADGYMNVSMSATLPTEVGDFAVEMTGGVEASDVETIAALLNEFAETLSGASATASGGGGSSVCPGCHGDTKCRFCKGDRTCHICLSGQLDHCLSCGGSNVCQYCGGDGRCKYCNGSGVV